MKPRYTILLWLNLKMSLNTPCSTWHMLIPSDFTATTSWNFTVLIYQKAFVIVTFFTMDSVLILLSSRWPATRNRTKSFRSRCNEPHHLCICRRKEPSEWKDPHSHTVPPSDFSSVACTGKRSAWNSRGNTNLYRNSDLYLWNSTAPAIGSALSQTANGRAIRKYGQSCKAFSLHSQLASRS